MNFFRQILFILLFAFTLSANSQTIEYCDSLIEEGIKANSERNHVKALEFFMQASAIAESKKWDDRLYRTLFAIGNTYYEMYDSGEALQYFFESYTVAVKRSNTLDELATLNNIANLYTRDENYDKAIEYYSKVYEIADEQDLDSRKGLPLMNLAYIYNKLGQLEIARSKILQALPYLKDNYNIAGQIVLIQNDLLLGHTSVARKKAFELYENTEMSEQIHLGAHTWQIVAKSYLAEKEYLLAANYAHKALEIAPEQSVMRDLYELLSDIYRKQNDYDASLRFKDSIIKLDKTLNEVKNGRLYYNNRVKFEIQNYKNQISEKEEKIASDQKIFYATIGILGSIVVIILLFFRQMKIISQRNRKITELNLEREKNQNLELEKQISDALLEQERLKNDIETKNRKLSAKALYLSDRNELIEEIVAYLSKKPILAKDATLANHVRSLKANLRTDNEWDNFITHFEEVNHGFLTRLRERHPQLTSNDIKFIAYIYMNLSVKEISSILNITIEACKKRKERLAIKMEMPKDLDLYNYISAI